MADKDKDMDHEKRLTRVEEGLISLTNSVKEIGINIKDQSSSFRDQNRINNKILSEMSEKISGAKQVSWPMIAVLISLAGLLGVLSFAILKPIQNSIQRVESQSAFNKIEIRAEFNMRFELLEEIVDLKIQLGNK